MSIRNNGAKVDMGNSSSTSTGSSANTPAKPAPKSPGTPAQTKPANPKQNPKDKPKSSQPATGFVPGTGPNDTSFYLDVFWALINTNEFMLNH
ncbi:MAG: hypothetical protein U0798_20770 [Gemmataceae bacterium]